jgi:exodeoxyribonuclease V alpha subunit
MTFDPRGSLAALCGDALRDEPPWPAAMLAALPAHNLGEDALYVAWEMARAASLRDPADARALMLMALAVLVSARQGSTRLPLSGSEGRARFDDLARSLGGTDADLARAQELLAELREARLGGTLARIDAVVGLPGDRKPLILDGYTLSAERLRGAEDRVGDALAARLAGETSVDAAAAIDDVVARPPSVRGSAAVLNGEQRRALSLALSRRLAVISGGPGTGKTSIVASLLRAAARLGFASDDVALGAPTGKAADRLRRAVAAQLAAVADPTPADVALAAALPEATTLHRLLGWAPDGFRFHAGDPLAARLVIVDEASMLDLEMLDALLGALRPEAILVLLGDADQLPSVEAGAVLRDLLPASDKDPRARAAVRLEESFRMSPADPDGRALLLAARAINRGQLPDPASARTVGELSWRGAELVVLTGEERAAFIDVWLRRAPAHPVTRRVHLSADGILVEPSAELAALFDDLERRRLLCVTRADVGWANRRCHTAVLDAAAAEISRDPLRGAAFYPGEPLIVTRNDYDRGLYNGDQGIVLRVARAGAEHHFHAVFRRGDAYHAFALDGLRGLVELAFAVTVHKSQGSEHDEVALLLPEKDVPLATRELVYTALTRARRSAVVAGDPAILVAAVARTSRRWSGLATRLSRDVTHPG